MTDTPIEFDKWLQFRCGRFTASEIHKLFTSGRRGMTDDELKEAKENKSKRTTVTTLFGDGALTYILEKASERLTMDVKAEIDSRPTNWGKEHEWDAKESYIEQGYGGEYFGIHNPRFFEFGEDFGCSPDFLNLKKKYGADFKCPYNSSEHLVNLTLKTQEDFKNKRWEYYCQLQYTMYKLNLDRYDFVSYDKRYREKKYQLKILAIEPDKEWVDECKMREGGAVKLLNEIIKSI